MATISHPHFACSDRLNGDAAAKAEYVPQRPAADDDSIVTEVFPAFDPAHDGCSEAGSSESSASEHYTHTAAADGRRTGADVLGGTRAAPGPAVDAIAAAALGGDDREATPTKTHQPWFPVEPGPEPEPERLPQLQQQQHPARDQPPSPSSMPQSTSGQTSPACLAYPVISPPYWAHGSHNIDAQATAPAFYNNDRSTESLVPLGGITLQDNEADEDAGSGGDRRGRHGSSSNSGSGSSSSSSSRRRRSRACWARSVAVDSCAVVNNGSATGLGAFVVWHVRVQTLRGTCVSIRKRYSEFDAFRRALVRAFPAFEAAVPALPPKSVAARFRPRVLERRRAGLQYFLNCILLNPEFSGSPVLKDFLFA